MSWKIAGCGQSAQTLSPLALIREEVFGVASMTFAIGESSPTRSEGLAHGGKKQVVLPDIAAIRRFARVVVVHE